MAPESPCVFLTGATGKLGRTFALGFAALGYGVAFVTRRAAAGVELERECVERGARRVLSVVADLTADGAPSVIARELASKGMFPEIAIHNARDVRYLKPETDGRTSRPQWQGEFLLGVVVPYELTLTLADWPACPLKTVINVASIYGVTAPNLRLYEHPELESSVNYGVTKAALIHLTKELAVRLAPRGISVNAVSYGGVEGRVDGGFRERYGRLCPTGRMLDDSQVFGAVKFLCSSDSSGMTGHNLIVDGGWTIW